MLRITLLYFRNPRVNTYEEAKYYAENFGNEIPAILVTAAAHMPRAMMIFKWHGVTPLASPTDFQLTGSRKEKWLSFPETINIEKLKAGIYEYTGIWYYKITIE